MRLVDRGGELSVLEGEYGRRGFSLVVVYGRRRIGKTFLLRWFCMRRPCVYYVAAELPYSVLAAEFSRRVSEALGVPLAGDVVEVLEALPRLWDSSRGKLVVVLDEFQYMVEADPSLPSRLMRSIDTVLQGRDMMLVLCGSSVSFFEKKLLGYRAPLYGRRTAEIRLRQMKLWDIWGFNPSLSLRETVELYAVVGGTPAYLARVGEPTFWRMVEEVLRPGSPLYDEPLWLLKQELREPRTYLAILRAVAEGRNEPSQVAQIAGVDPRSIARYIDVLEELEILQRLRPLGRRRPVQLRFQDNFFRFWFTYTLPLRTYLETGDTRKALEAVKGSIDQYMGRVFEETVVPQLALKLVEKGLIPVRPLETGPWWKAGIDIDLVIRSPGQATVFIEAKWSRLSRAEARRELNKLEGRAAETGLQSPVNYYVLIARELDEPVLEENHVAVDLDWLQRNNIVRPSPSIPVHR